MSEKKFSEVRKTKLRRIAFVASDPGDGELERGEIGEDVAAVLAQLAKLGVAKTGGNRGPRFGAG